MFSPFTPETVCWMCLDAPADSQDHKFKRTDVLHTAGPGPYKGPDGTVMATNENVHVPIQGSRSSKLKHKRTMCKRCNGTRSQPFDRAYETFIDYVETNQDRILTSKEIDLREVFGRDAWEEQALNVGREVAKHAGGRLADWKLLAPAGVREFLLDGEPFPACLAVWLEIRTDLAETAKWAREQGLVDGTLWICKYPREVHTEAGEQVGIAGFLGFRWLRIYWVIGSDLIGARNPFTAPTIKLSEGRNTLQGKLSVFEGSDW